MNVRRVPKARQRSPILRDGLSTRILLLLLRPNACPTRAFSHFALCCSSLVHILRRNRILSRSISRRKSCYSAFSSASNDTTLVISYFEIREEALKKCTIVWYSCMRFALSGNNVSLHLLAEGKEVDARSRTLGKGQAISRPHTQYQASVL